MNVLHVGFGFRPWRWGGLISYAEDLMDSQVVRGDDVGYFFRGRQYPFMTATRLRRWRRRGVRMYEVVNSSLPVGGERGTLRPDLELDHPPTERAFERAIEAQRPDVVHFQELLGLPTSLIDVARRRAVPTVFTMQDYFALCPTIKLWDAEQQSCRRRRPGHFCRICSRDAPASHQELVDTTMLFEQTRFLEAVPGLKHVPRPRPVVRVIRAAGGWTQRQWRERDLRAKVAVESPTEAERIARTPPAEAYDRRRDLNVARLSRVDGLVAMSTRVGEICTAYGVADANLRVMHLTLGHIGAIRPRRIDAARDPVVFATNAGCASVAKGVEVVLGAVGELRRRGLGRADYLLEVRGYVDPVRRPRLEAAPEVSLEGLYGPEHLNDLLPRWDVGIVPSVWEEAYGYVGVEFLAGGVPVIGNAVGGIPDYCVDGATGWLNRDNSARGLADIMEAIVRDPGQVPRLNARILERRDAIVKSFGSHADEIHDLYVSVRTGARAA